ncbi:MAG: hypothetical protein AAFV80_06620 [Bacteroidota bacterium]
MLFKKGLMAVAILVGMFCAFPSGLIAENGSMDTQLIMESMEDDAWFTGIEVVIQGRTLSITVNQSACDWIKVYDKNGVMRDQIHLCGEGTFKVDLTEYPCGTITVVMHDGSQQFEVSVGYC